MFHYRAQTITKTASAIVAPFSGTVFLVTLGKQSPLGNLNDYSKNCKARHGIRGKQFFYLNIFTILVLGIFKADEFCTVDK